MRRACFAFAVLCGSAAAPSHAQLYQVPFRAGDFDDGNLKVFWGRAKHSDSGVQEHGYDLGAMRHDVIGGWTEARAGGSKDARNEDSLIYRKKIHAMRAGRVIACWRNAPENEPDGRLHPMVGAKRIYGGGNGFWIEHDDGTRAEYAHMLPGSVPSELCPHDKELLPVAAGSNDVVDCWPQVRVAAGKRVQAGQFLGRVGNTGTGSHPHLHVHVERGGRADTVKSGGEAVRIEFERGLSSPVDDSDPAGRWTSFAGKPIPPGKVLVWPPRTLTGEVARHGHPADRFQDLFDHLADSGFWPVWIDAYSVDGKSYLNHLWRPAEGAWRAHFLKDGTSHQKLTDDAIEDHFSPVFVDGSTSGDNLRYTAVFVKDKPGLFLMRHGLTTAQHDAELEEAKKRGLNPTNVSVASVDGERFYTVLYRSDKAGRWQVKSQIPSSLYQLEYDLQKAAGRRPLYLNAYKHDGDLFLSAVFSTVSRAERKDRHGLSSGSYQDEWDSALKSGMLTRVVTGVDGADAAHVFAAAWWR